MNIGIYNYKLLNLMQRILLSIFAALLLLPTTASAQVAPLPAREPGVPSGSYSLGDSDAVNLFTGNLHYDIPLLEIQGRGEIQQAINFSLEKQWVYTENQLYSDPPLYMGQYSEIVAASNFVGRVGFQSDPIPYYDPEAPCNYADYTPRMEFVEPNGTRHLLQDRVLHGNNYLTCNTQTLNLGNIFESTAGDFITFVADTQFYVSCYNVPACTNKVDGYIYFKNGSKARVSDTFIQWMEDRNGNKTTYEYQTTTCCGKAISKITDSIGRQTKFEFNVNEPAPYGLCTKITFDGFGGGEANKKIIRISTFNVGDDPLRHTQSYDNYTGEIFYDDPNDNLYITHGTPGGDIKAIWLPDNRSYQFKYNVLGQLARIDLPTGGSIEYDFADIAQLPLGHPGSDPRPTNRVTEKRVYSRNNVLVGKTAFSIPTTYTSGVFAPGWARAGVVRDIEQFSAAGARLSKTRHYFYGSPNDEYFQIGYPQPQVIVPWWNGKEIRTESFDSDGTTILRINQQEWRQRAPSWWCATLSPCHGTADQYAGANNPFVAESKTTLTDGNLVTTTSSINPSNGNYAVDAFNNVTDVWQYDYGVGAPGQLLKRAHTDYVTDTNYTSYTGSYLLSLPQQAWVSSDSAGNNKKFLTEFEYDNYGTDSHHAGLTSRSEVVGFDSSQFGTGYIRRGNLTAKTSYTDAQNHTGAVTEYSQYDVLGNVTAIIDANNNTTAISYEDKFGYPDGEALSNTSPDELNASPSQLQLSTYAFPTAMTNVLNWVSHSQFNYHTGTVVNIQDVNGIVSKFVYNDPLNRPTQAVTAVGTPLERQTTSEYHDGPTEHFVRQTSDLNNFNDNLLKAESYYDGFGRTTEIRKYEADGGYVVTQTEYDSLGRTKKTTNPYRLAEISTNNPVIWKEGFYDALGRTTKIKSPEQIGSSIIYSEVNISHYANAATFTDQAGKMRRSVTNALGQTIRVDEPTGNGLGIIANPNQATNYTYDVLGNLIQIHQEIGTTSQQCGSNPAPCAQNRNFVYDGLSRLKQATNPESGTISYIYDANGNLTSRNDAQNIVTSYEYDVLNRIKQRSYSGEPTTRPATPTVTYTYDNLTNSKGKLTKVNSTDSTTEYTAFDILGRVTAHKQSTGGHDYVTGYTYNLVGAMIEETYPNGRVVKNTLNSNGELSSVQSRKDAVHPFNLYAGMFKYTAAGAVSSMTLGNGKWESTVFNSRLQPTQIALGSSKDATDLLKLNYTYNTPGNADNNGNVITQKITVPTMGAQTGFSATQTYTYDELNRLSTVEEKNDATSAQTWKQSFTFDRFGNRRFNTTGTTTPDLNNCPAAICNPTPEPLNNRLKIDQDGDSLDDYKYDPAGNTTQAPSRTPYNTTENRTYTYNAENKQTQVTITNSSDPALGQYVYDGNGRRVKKLSALEETIFVYDAAGKMIAEYSTALNPTPRVSYLTADSLGTPRINTDQNGDVISRNDYQPYGENIATPERNAGLKYLDDDKIRKQFTGYERDKETELDYAQARYYTKNAGRFMSPDPLYIDLRRLSDPQLINIYSYSRNNPVRYTDPTGLDITLKCEVQKNCQTATDELNARRRKEFDVKLGANNKLEVVGKVDVSKLSKGEAELYRAIKDPSQHATLEVGQITEGGKPQLDFGAHLSKGVNKVDLENISKLDAKGNEGGLNSGDVIAHEALEAFYTLSMSMEDAHRAVSALGYPGLLPPSDATIPRYIVKGEGYFSNGATFSQVINDRSGSIQVTVTFNSPIPYETIAPDIHDADEIGEEIRATGARVKEVKYVPKPK